MQIDPKLISCLDRPDDKKDPRNYLLSTILPKAVAVPEEYMELKAKLSKVGSQLYGTCTSWGGVNGVKEFQEGVNLSEYFNYVNSKKISGIYDQEGEYIQNALKAICDYGVCEQALFPDEIPSSGLWIDYVKKEPSIEAYENAKQYKGKTYWEVDNQPQSFREAMFVYKTPVVFAMTWYESYNSTPKSGVLPLPSGKNVGGHAITAVAYDKNGSWAKNSWGINFGNDGFFYIPFSEWDKHQIYSCWVLLDIINNQKTMKYVVLKNEQFLLEETLKLALNIGDPSELEELKRKGLVGEPEVIEVIPEGYVEYPLVRKERYVAELSNLRKSFATLTDLIGL